MKKQIHISSIEELPAVASLILSYCPGKKIFAFLGEMGAGKTTLIAAICKVLEVKEQVSSPTFAIVNEYLGKEQLFHIDLYRLKSAGEAIATGIEEYLTGKNYCFIEWPQLIMPLLPDDIVTIQIEIVNEHERLLTIENP